MALIYLLFGTVFGLVLSRSGAADYDFIQRMFLFESFQLYGIIGTAVIVTAPGLWLLKRLVNVRKAEPAYFLRGLFRDTVGIEEPDHRVDFVGPGAGGEEQHDENDAFHRAPPALRLSTPCWPRAPRWIGSPS